MDIENILLSGYVERFHATPGITKPQLNGHQWGVAVLCRYIHPEASADMLFAALTHDCTEMVTGDTPAIAKWASPELKRHLDALEQEQEVLWGITPNISAEEKAILKVCDCLEGMHYCLYRYKCGELMAKEPFYKWAEYLLTFKQVMSAQATELYNSLIEQMGEPNL